MSPHLESHSFAVSRQQNLALQPIPDFSSNLEWVTAYLVQRQLSHASWAYPYLLWFIIAIVFILFTLLRWSGFKGGYLWALWSKWAIRRRTWRKKHTLAVAIKLGRPHTQPKSLPPNAHILAAVLIWIGVILITFLGPDYMAPGSFFWTLDRFPTLHKRSSINFTFLQPRFTITKMWYTSGDRTGLIAFSLYPLTVLFALKAAPFAIAAIPQLTHVCFDKLAFLHRWTAFLVWLLTTLHVILWSVQLAIDHRNGHNAYHYVWIYTKFRYAWVAYISLTILTVSSLSVFRHLHYETFWFLHVLFVPLTLIFSALHHPPVWWWCWVALVLWGAERVYRFVRWLNTNGFLSRLRIVSDTDKEKSRFLTTQYDPEALPVHSLERPKESSRFSSLPKIDITRTSPLHRSLSRTSSSYTPPPGFVHAELLTGKAVRMRIVTPGFVSWAPGEHFLINIPCISRLTSHPFTIASVYDAQAPSLAGRELVFFIRAKKGWTKRLWDTVARTQAHGLRSPAGDAHPPTDAPLPPRGIIMRAFVDGPFGSAASARWNEHSTVLLIAGGSGVSFALSVLEYVCKCLTGRDGRELGGHPGRWWRPQFKTQRVRFVWLAREFAHIHWCAAILRRCMHLNLSQYELQIDIFVTNSKPSVGPHLPPHDLEAKPLNDVLNRLPAADQDMEHRSPSLEPEKSTVAPQVAVIPVEIQDEEEEEDDVVMSCCASDELIEEDRGDLGHEEHPLDLTNFDGDDDTKLPGEDLLNVAVKHEGQVRRSLWKRGRAALAGKPKLDDRQAVEHQREKPRKVAQTPSSTILPSKPSSSVAIASPTPRTRSSSLRTAPPLTTKSEMFLYPPTGTSDSSASPSRPDSLRPPSTHSDWSGDAHTLAALVSEAAAREDVRLDLDEQMIDDIMAVAACARAGRPSLNKILADEVAQARGSIIVGCCGPTSLSAVMRKHIAAQIDPAKIRQGDRRGFIDLVSEDFEY